MKVSKKFIVAFALVGLLPAAAAGVNYFTALQAPPGDQDVVELLSGISYSPGKSSLDSVLGSAAVQDLIDIAEDTSSGSDPGLRIRAFRALGHYKDTADAPLAVEALHEAIDRFAPETTGTELLYLRASMSALVDLHDLNAVPPLAALLEHPSRDIRAAAAWGLGQLGTAEAEDALRARYPIEDQLQVRIAIHDAIQQLGSNP